jgi:voltage-gated potassium channel
MLKEVKERTNEVLSIADPGDAATRLVNGFLIVLLVVNVVAFFLQTFEDLSSRYAIFFRYLETFSVAFFTIEYVVRLWVADLEPMYRGAVTGRLRYAFTDILAITDLIAILPFYLPIIVPFNPLVIRVLRLFRLARLVKLTRYSDSVDLIVRVITKQREFLLITFTIQMILLLVSAAIIFYIEHEEHPEMFPNIFSALYWGLGAVTSIGSDVRPLTPAGKVAGAVLAFLQVVAMALPIGVITAGIEQEMSLARETEEKAARGRLRSRYLIAGGDRRPGDDKRYK